MDEYAVVTERFTAWVFADSFADAEKQFTDTYPDHGRILTIEWDG